MRGTILWCCCCVLSLQAWAGEDYFQELDRQLSQLAQPSVDLMDRAAQALIDGGRLVVVGDPGLALEMVGRPGAMAWSVVGSAKLGDVVLCVGTPPADGLAISLHEGSATVRMAQAWQIQLELFAACTRQDRVPVVRQSLEVDTRRHRLHRYGDQRFHHDLWLDPIAPGVLGQAYLGALRSTLRDIATASGDALDAADQRINQTLDAQGQIYLRPAGRALPYHSLDLPWPTLCDDTRVPGLNDLVIAIGGDAYPGSEAWGEEDFRDAGRGVIWVIEAYNTYPHDLRPGERVVDLMGDVGDCVVKVDHYDTRLGPVSGVSAQAVAQRLAYHRQP